MKIKFLCFIMLFSVLCIVNTCSQAHNPKKEALVVATLDIESQESLLSSVTAAMNWICEKGLRIVVAGLAIQSGLELIPGVDAASIDTSSCLMPLGTYELSCRNMHIELLSHPNLPDFCKLTAKCKHIYENMTEANAEFIFLQRHELTLKNDNGTLVAVSEKQIPLPQRCEKIQGSYMLTCQETDPDVMSSVPLNKGICQLFVICEGLKGKKEKSSVYYLAYEKDQVVLENCDGRLVIHRDKKKDHSCKGISMDDVKNMGKIYGKTYLRLDKDEL